MSSSATSVPRHVAEDWLVRLHSYYVRQPFCLYIDLDNANQGIKRLDLIDFAPIKAFVSKNSTQAGQRFANIELHSTNCTRRDSADLLLTLELHADLFSAPLVEGELWLVVSRDLLLASLVELLRERHPQRLFEQLPTINSIIERLS